MTEGAWPVGYDRYGARGLDPGARVRGRVQLATLTVLCQFLIGRRPVYRARLVAGADAWTRTHTHARTAFGIVHRAYRSIDLDGRSWVELACGVTLPVCQVVFTASAPDCLHPSCSVRAEQKAERPEPVDRPDGAYQGEAAKTTTGVTLPDNSVGIPPDEDSFRSVKSVADNHVNAPVLAESGINRVSSESLFEPTSPVQARSRRPHGP